jgi:hypothetical protein
MNRVEFTEKLFRAHGRLSRLKVEFESKEQILEIHPSTYSVA